MFKKSSIIYLFSVLIILFLVFQSCNDNGKKTNGDSKGNADLIIKDDKGEKVNLKLRPKVGDTLRYKMIANTLSDEKSPATKDQDLHTEQLMTYYYTQEVAEISEAGVITYKMKYDSIRIESKVSAKDSTISEVYNSNVEDSVHALPDFIQYNALIGEYFKLRVSDLGEVYDAYELENIHEKIFKALGDTLTPQEKAAIKESMGADAIKSIIQNQYQKFPEHEVYKDSSWTFTSETSLLIFPIKNLLSYKLLDIKEEEGNYILTIDAALGIEFISKEQKEKGLTIKLTNSNTGGKGTVSFNLSRGCIVKKETSTNIDLDMKLSAQGQSANSLQKLTTSLTVELL
ncbi:MAG: hypothetical protein ISS16_05680 [Ignavibacteria bacterium]|nr:hypothetical protein [Ignavibacteria bacterium]